MPVKRDREVELRRIFLGWKTRSPSEASTWLPVRRPWMARTHKRPGWLRRAWEPRFSIGGIQRGSDYPLWSWRLQGGRATPPCRPSYHPTRFYTYNSYPKYVHVPHLLAPPHQNPPRSRKPGRHPSTNPGIRHQRRKARSSFMRNAWRKCPSGSSSSMRSSWKTAKSCPWIFIVQSFGAKSRQLSAGTRETTSGNQSSHPGIKSWGKFQYRCRTTCLSYSHPSHSTPGRRYGEPSGRGERSDTGEKKSLKCEEWSVKVTIKAQNPIFSLNLWLQCLLSIVRRWHLVVCTFQLDYVLVSIRLGHFR